MSIQLYIVYACVCIYHASARVASVPVCEHLHVCVCVCDLQFSFLPESITSHCAVIDVCNCGACVALK